MNIKLVFLADTFNFPVFNDEIGLQWHEYIERRIYKFRVFSLRYDNILDLCQKRIEENKHALIRKTKYVAAILNDNFLDAFVWADEALIDYSNTRCQVEFR